jgi:hypothetical protein
MGISAMHFDLCGHIIVDQDLTEGSHILPGLLSPEEFAESAAEHIVEPIVNGTLSLDRKNLALVIKSSTGKPLQTINLARFYANYQAQPEALGEILKRIANFARERPDLSDYEQVAPHLMPVVGDRADYELTWLKAYREYGEAAGSLRTLTICDYFVLYPVVDTGATQARIPTQILDQWPLDFQAVMSQAGQNLIDSTEHYNFSSMYDNKTDKAILHESIWCDSYDSMRLFYNDMSGLEVSGERLFLMLNHGCLLIWGSKNVVGTAFVLAKLEEADQSNNGGFRPLPPFILHHIDGVLNIYNPHPKKEAALYEGMKKHQAKYLAQAYERQREYLFDDVDIQQQELFPSAFVVVQSKDFRLATTCTWTEGVDCLLPKTDSIAFARVNPDGKSANVVAEASWEEVQAILPEQMTDLEMFPPRFQTSGFPSAQQIKKLGMRSPFR